MAHAGGRPRKPTELKKIQGTYRKDRDAGEEESSDLAISTTSVIVQEGETLPVPKTLKTKEGKKFYNLVIKNLREIRILSEADLPQIETMARYLERTREADRQLNKLDISNIDTLDEYEKYSKMLDRYSKRFDELAMKYYISPLARVQLKLSELNAIRTTQEIKKNDSAISNLLGGRK